MATRIRTNHQPRDVLSWHDLSAKEQAEFDYLDSEGAREGAQFMRYRGDVYDLGEFMRAPDSLKGWDGYYADSYFSAIVVRFVDHGEAVVAGLALS